MRFLPTTEFTFEEHLVISAAGTTLRATLQGRGVAPTLEVRGEQSEDGKTEKEVPAIETLTPNPNLNPHPNPSPNPNPNPHPNPNPDPNPYPNPNPNPDQVPVVEIGAAETTLLHLGDCLVGDEARADLDLLNTSQFPNPDPNPNRDPSPSPNPSPNPNPNPNQVRDGYHALGRAG